VVLRVRRAPKNLRSHALARNIRA